MAGIVLNLFLDF